MRYACGATPLIVSGTPWKVMLVFALHAMVPDTCVPCGLAPGPWIGVSLPSVGGSPGRV